MHVPELEAFGPLGKRYSRIPADMDLVAGDLAADPSFHFVEVRMTQ